MKLFPSALALNTTKKLLRGFAVCTVLLSSLFVLQSADAFSPLDETKDLKNAVEKLSFWLGNSPERAGWQRYLLMNQLSTQTALGNQADLAALQRIQSRFHSHVSGLNHPVFQGVKTALDKQIQRLAGSRRQSIPGLLLEAKYNFTAPSIGVMNQQRDQVIADIDSLIRYSYETMTNSDQDLLFHDLQLAQIKAYLRAVKIEIAPEVSVGKMDSMIRDVQADIDKVVEDIDAMPIIPGPDDDDDAEGKSDEASDQDDDPSELNLSAPKSDLPAQILIGNVDGPSEDHDEKTLKELESQKEVLEAKKKTLRDRRKTILKTDLPRLRERAKIVRQLRKYELLFEEQAQKYGNPYVVIAATSLRKFSRSFLHGSSGNLQEDMLNRLGQVQENLQDLAFPDKARTASGNLGESLRWLDAAGQSPSLVTAVRTKYSHPNAYLSIDGNLINNAISQPISDRSPIRQKAFGRLVRGWAETNGSVSLQLLDDPNQIHAQLRLSADVTSNAYVEQRKIQVYTNAYGTLAADRQVFIGLNGVSWSASRIDANFQSCFAGTNSRFRIVNRFARKAFDKNQSKANDLTRKQAKEKGLVEFNQQTEKPLIEANRNLREIQRSGLMKANLLPAIRMNSTHQRINVVVKKETDATLAAPDRPHSFGVNPQVAVRINDTLLSNYLDPIFSGKTLTSEELANQISEITGEVPAGLMGQDAEGEEAEEGFSIGFTRVRPIQFEFEGQKIRVVVSGRKFAQGDQEIDAGMKIIMEFKVHDDNGQLKFGRDGKVLFEFLDPDRTTPALVAFRRFLDDNLNKNLKAEDMETTLPNNFIPVEQIPALADSPLAKQLRLVQFRADQGWLYLGWNRESYAGQAYSWIYDLPAIWKR